MSETSRISITDKAVRRRVQAVMSAYRTIAARERERKELLAPRKIAKVRNPKGKEERKPKHRMYLQNEDYLDQHGKVGVNIHK